MFHAFNQNFSMHLLEIWYINADLCNISHAYFYDVAMERWYSVYTIK